jgi:hypothetical protein
MNARRLTWCVIVLASLVSTVGLADADEPFSERSLRGTYAFSGSGYLIGQPAAVVGVTRFDGHGGCETSAKLKVITSGAVVPLSSLSCTYTVDADGTGTQELTFSIGSFHSDLAIAGDEINFVLSGPAATVANGIAKLQRKGSREN